MKDYNALFPSFFILEALADASNRPKEKKTDINMIQKIIIKKRNARKQFFALVFLFFLFQASGTSAQSLPSVDANSVAADTISGTPVDEIISAMSGGGLSALQDLSALKPEITEPAPEKMASSDISSPEPKQPEPVAFNPDSLKYLESQGGLSSSPEIDSENPTVFKLAVKFFERAIFKKDVEFAKRPQFDAGLDISGTPTFDADTAGFAIIKKGDQSVEIIFDRKYDSPPVITATLSLQQYKDAEVRAAAEDLLLVSDVKYIVTDVSKKGFEIMMDRKADSDIPFSWHALAVSNPKTFKKKGDSSDGGITAISDSGDSPQKAAPSGSGNNPGSGPAAVGQSEISSRDAAGKVNN